ncbi:hypothetical protein B0H10DRAFT_65422 [Mycena sp. CBHHK59/15]|nr:hypothetical protein B0H10DRAFT_65422 [Mycena sp. CBHHK59/15]
MTIPLSVDTPSHILLQTQVTDHNSDPHPRRYLPFPSSPVTSTSENNIHVSESFNSNDDSSSKLTSSDKLSELPVPLTTTSPNRGIRSQNARAARRSLDSLPSFPTSDFAPLGHSPRLNQAWGTIPASKSLPLASNSDISLGTDTPKHRVSFDSDRVSIKQAFSRVNKGSDLPDSPSQSRSRAASPLRIFQHLSAGIHRRTHDPFVPVNPFVLSRSGLFSFLWRAHMNTDEEAQPEIAVFPGTMKAFVTDTLLRQIYLHMLLRLPSLYFSRVARIFEDAEVSRPDIERMIEAGMGGDAFPPSASAAADLYPPITSSLRESLAAASTPAVDRIPLPLPEDWTPALVSPALVRFKNSCVPLKSLILNLSCTPGGRTSLAH